jgi:hypothetical protein
MELAAQPPAQRWLLIDKSALVRTKQVPDANLGEPCICAITRLEMLRSARSPDDYARLEGYLEAFHELRATSRRSGSLSPPTANWEIGGCIACRSPTC